MDIMGEFLKGHQAGQQQQEHQQQMEENKLRLMILKHQIDGVKIQDAALKRQAMLNHVKLMEDQSVADLPHDTNLQSQSHAGAMTGLPDVVSSMVRDRMGMGEGDVGPSTMAAPNAQQQAPQMTPSMVNIPPGGYGEPGFAMRPRSMEDVLKANYTAKFNEPVTLSGDQERSMGGRVIARGPGRAPTQTDLATKAAGGDAAKAIELLHPPPRANPNSVTPEERTRDYELRKRAQDFREAHPGSGGVSDQTGVGGTATKRLYDAFVTSYYDRYPKPPKITGDPANDAIAKELLADEKTRTDEAAKKLKPGEKPLAPPKPNLPAPSLEKWYAMTPKERTDVLAHPEWRITDAELEKRSSKGKTAQTGTVAGTPNVPAPVAAALKLGSTYTKADGSTGTITAGRYRGEDGQIYDVLEDGSIQVGPR